MGIVDVGIIRDRSPGPKATLLNEKQPVVVAPAKPKISDLQSELFVKGKGFTIKPLKKPEESIPNSAPKTAEQNHEKSAGASIPPYVKYEKVNSDPKDNDLTPTIYNNSKSEDERSRAISPQPLPKVYYSNPGAKQKTNFASVKDFSDVVDASMNAAQSSRPKISDPVLEGTTAAELIAEGTALVPTRKAPSVPSANVSDTCTEGYDKELPPIPSQAFKSRPLSSPVEIAEERKLLKELKDSKEYPALTKIASLMKSASISRSSSINEKNKAKVKPEIKKLKFDREKLKNIEISNPIPQVDSSSNAEKESMVMRAQSMREPSQPKPILQSFGSMRVQTDGKRPTSVHVHARPTSPLPRPTSPPPRPPPPKTLATEYSYDDCLNLLAEKNAPLAHIDEENSPTSNIYAVIEDSPKPQRKLNNIERKVRFDDQRHEEPNYLEKEESLTSDAKKSLNSASSGSTESMGLLGEIVSEIQARNLDSIYSSGTLKKKKGSEKEKEREGYDSTNANLFNENLAGKASFESSSNGYPNPKNIDTPNNLEINNSLVKNLNQPKPQMIINDLSKKTNVEDTPKGNQVNVNTYKPYSSSLVRNSGPLSYSYKGKVEPKAVVEKDAKSEFLASQSSEVESSDDNPNTPSSASPFVKSSFTRPPLLGAPTLPKVTPLSITSSFSKDKTDEHESSKAPAKVTKSVSNLTGNSKRTLSSGKNAESNVSSSVASRPASSKFSGISQRPSPSRKGSGTKEDGAVPEPPNRPLPSIPKAEGGKSSKSDSSSAISRPSASSLPRKNSKENLLGKVPGGRKPLTEKKPEIGKLPPKKNSNHISHLQSKFEGNGNVSEIKKSVHQNVSSRPKTAGETKTE